MERGRRNLRLVAFLLPPLLGTIFGPWIVRDSEYRDRITEEAMGIITEKGYQEWTDKETAVVLFYLQGERHDVLDRFLGLAIFGVIGWALKDRMLQLRYSPVMRHMESPLAERASPVPEM